MQKILLILWLLFSFLTARCQFEQNIRNDLKSKPKPFLKLNSNNGFISNKNIKTIGVVAGVRFNKQLSFGIGFRELLTKIETDDYFSEEFSQPLNLKLHYFSLSPTIEYAYFASKRWEISIPVQLCFGDAYYKDQFGRRWFNSLIVTYEPGISASYFFVDFISVGVGIGYRLALYKKKDVFDRFTAPTYQLKFGIYLARIYKTLRTKNNHS